MILTTAFQWMYSVSSSRKGLSTSFPSILPEASIFLPACISCILCSPLSQGCYHCLWHHADICTCVQFKSNKCSICFQDDNLFIFCNITVSCTYKKFSWWCCYVLLVYSAFACGCELLRSVDSLNSHFLASINFLSRWELLSFFWEVPDWAPCVLDLLMWERPLDFPQRSRNL